MHEYSHVLFRARFANQRFQVPTWLDEGCAEYLAIPWSQEEFNATTQTIKDASNAQELPTYQSFSRSVYPNARAGYAIARLMIVELMQNRQLDTIVHILDEVMRREEAVPEIIKEICGLKPKQLYEKILADCGVDKPLSRQKKRRRIVYWAPWESRRIIPTTFRECLYDLYYWKLEHYGRKYDEHELNSSKYPHWRVFAIAYFHFLKNTSHAVMKKSERDELRAMVKLDRSARLLTYVSMADFVPALWQSLPIETTDYWTKCIENLNAGAARENFQKEFSSYLQRFSPKIDMTPLESFTSEFDAFTAYRFEILGEKSDSANYDRLPQLTTAFVRLLKAKAASKWSQTLQRYMQSLILHDEHRQLPIYISPDDLEVLSELDLPPSIRQYLVEKNTRSVQ